MIDGGEHLGFAGRYLLGVLACSSHAAKLQSVLTKLACHETAHLVGVLARIGLGHHAHRHQSVLSCQVGYAAEGSAVVERTLKEELHLRVLDGLACMVDDALKHEVGLLQLVVEEEIVLRELHCQGVGMSLGEVGTQHVHAAEHPATARALLVVDALCGSLHAEVSVNRTGIGTVLHQVVDTVGSDGIEERLVGNRCLLHFLDLREHLRRDASLLGLSHRGG